VKGISYLYAAITDISSDSAKWPKTNATNSDISNVWTSEAHLIHISQANIKKMCSNFTTCGVVITVEGGIGTKTEVNEFSIKVHSNMARLIEKTP